MQAEAHFDFVVWHSLVETSVIGVLPHLPRPFSLAHDLEEADQAHVAELRDFVRWDERQLSRLRVFNLRIIIELPYEEKGIADVLVRSALVPVDNAMHDFPDLIHKEHDSLLKHLRCVSELSDVAETKYSDAFVAGQQRVYIVSLLHVLTDDLRASLSEAYREQASDLGQRGLQHFCLQGRRLALRLLALDLLNLELLLVLLQLLHTIFLCLLRCLDWVLCDVLDFGNHVLNGAQHEVLRHFGQQEGSHGKHSANHQSRYDSEHRCCLREFAQVMHDDRLDQRPILGLRVVVSDLLLSCPQLGEVLARVPDELPNDDLEDGRGIVLV